jgi:oligopeptide/dipeptide ABC transporter ATP-binding protein
MIVRAGGPLLEAQGLAVRFPIRRGLFERVVGHVHAVEDVDLAVAAGETLGIVGESGSGKSTLGRALLRLLEPSAGRIVFAGHDISRMSRQELRPLRRRMQMVFQDPYSSLNPRMRVREAIGEAVRLHGLGRGAEVADKVVQALARVGLPPDAMQRYPKAFSGGQRQRLAIARALVVEPELLIADEPVSALDVSIQAEIINLLGDLRRRLRLTMLFISHDLAVVELVADRVLVLYLGRVMEVGPARALFRSPIHPYTRALVDAIPGRSRAGRRQLAGEIPDPSAPPTGCVFRTRCPHAIAACGAEPPALREMAPGRFKACIRDDLDLRPVRAA